MKAVVRLVIAVLAVVTTLTGCSIVEKEVENQIDIAPNVQEEETIPPVNTSNPLIIESTPEKYTYNNLMADVEELQNRYGSTIQPVKICDTADDRTVCDIIIGNQQAENQILISGSMHAREYITTQIVMRQLCDCLEILNDKTVDEYKGISKKELLENVTIHFIPMINPDGVSISQFGLDGILDQDIKNAVMQMNSSGYEQWKANAEGVDINRNFDAGWNEYIGPSHPSSDGYKGEYPGSCAEAKGLIELTQDYKFKRTISYHTCGSLIYWYYKQSGETLDESRVFAESVSQETGYVLDGDYQSVDAAGYKDWAVYKKDIPSITIEVGNENGQGIVNPVPISSFEQIWDRNKNVVYATLYDLKHN